MEHQTPQNKLGIWRHDHNPFFAGSWDLPFSVQRLALDQWGMKVRSGPYIYMLPIVGILPNECPVFLGWIPEFLLLRGFSYL